MYSYPITHCAHDLIESDSLANVDFEGGFADDFEADFICGESLAHFNAGMTESASLNSKFWLHLRNVKTDQRSHCIHLELSHTSCTLLNVFVHVIILRSFYLHHIGSHIEGRWAFNDRHDQIL